MFVAIKYTLCADKAGINMHGCVLIMEVVLFDESVDTLSVHDQLGLGLVSLM